MDLNPTAYLLRQPPFGFIRKSQLAQPMKPLSPSRSAAFAVSAILALILFASHAFGQITRQPNTTLQMPTNPTTTYTSQTAFSGVTFSAPIAVATPPGETNRLFVVERAGRIKVIPNLNSPSLSTFLDISTRVVTPGEQGLLGLA